jgi:hypothetical protein
MAFQQAGRARVPCHVVLFAAIIDGYTAGRVIFAACIMIGMPYAFYLDMPVGVVQNARD